MIHVCFETRDCTGDIIFSKGLLNGLAGKGITSAVSLLFSGLLYLAALDCTYPHYLQFISPQRRESISFKTSSSALAVPLEDFAVLYRRRERAMKLTFLLPQESQMCFHKGLSKNSTPGDSFPPSFSTHHSSVSLCPNCMDRWESLLSPCLIIGNIQSIKNPSSISSWNAAARAGVYVWELDKSWLSSDYRQVSVWRQAVAETECTLFPLKIIRLFTCQRGWKIDDTAERWVE